LIRYQFSLWDCVYLAVAIEYDCPLELRTAGYLEVQPHASHPLRGYGNASTAARANS
jgi:hypothetical protein